MNNPAARAALLAATSLTLAAISLTLAGCATELKPIVPVESLRTLDAIELPPAPPQAQAVPEPKPAPAELVISLADVRSRVISNNLEIATALIDPTIAKENLTEAEAAFEATFTTRVSYANLDTPTASTLEGSQVTQLSIAPGINQPLRTGGNVRVETPINRLETNNQFSTLNPSYQSDLTLSVTQPLLRGVGRDATEQRIRVAFYQQQQAEARTKLEVIRVISSADRAYWRLKAARDQLAAQVNSLQLAEAQRDRAQRRFDAKLAPEIDVIAAEAAIADRLDAILRSENDLRARQRELKRLMNDPDLPIDSPTILIPETPPQAVALAIDTPSLLQLAVSQRAELIDVELQLAQQSANIAAAKNARLPLVNFEYQFGVNGLGGSFDDSIELASDLDYIDHRFGLAVEVPIHNTAARARYRSALLRRVQLLSTHSSREQQIRAEVLNAIDAIETNWKRVESARTRVELNRRLVDSETRLFDNGQRTSTNVLESQNRLLNAEVALAAAEAEYQISQIDLAYATGLTLGQAKIAWQPTPPPRER